MWHYAQDGKPIGPVCESEVEKAVHMGAVIDQTLVWREGMTEWLPAVQTPLAALFVSKRPATPPPVPVLAGSFEVSTAPKKGFCLLVYVIGAACGWAITEMLPTQLVIRMLAGTIVGLILGLIPYLVGRKKTPRLAKSALIWCSLAGCAFGLLLALPAFIVFTIIVLVKDPETQS